MFAADNLLNRRYWRGLLRLQWGRLTGNGRMAAAGRLDQVLARIAQAQRHASREAARHMAHWRAARTAVGPDNVHWLKPHRFH